MYWQPKLDWMRVSASVAMRARRGGEICESNSLRRTEESFFDVVGLIVWMVSKRSRSSVERMDLDISEKR